jgi:hypothetical protein
VTGFVPLWLTSYVSVLFTSSFVFVSFFVNFKSGCKADVTFRVRRCPVECSSIPPAGWLLTGRHGQLHSPHVTNEWSCVSAPPYAFVPWAGTALHFLNFPICNCHSSNCDKILRCNLEFSRCRHVPWSLTRSMIITQNT